ncbi:hypothetical protein ABVK25_007408 [Lepraria finkii]|uniref:EF-hand domain-containing protein n=1 Tax=Lepraria finkii TaxID=1340010 RepID=A0ABR4B5R6_9LECA
MSMPPTYKPSPLSFGSPRTSPFRRPESPASPSTTIRPTTPTKASSTPNVPQTSPSKLQNASTPASNEGFWTPRELTPSLAPRERDQPVSPTRNSSAVTTIAANQSSTMGRPQVNGDALLKLPTTQVREMREGFQILDRDNDGLVNRDDVVDMLTNLGQPSSASDITPFFPGASQTIPLPTFLSTLSSLLAPLAAKKKS